jgi:hypothetical protein
MKRAAGTSTAFSLPYEDVQDAKTAGFKNDASKNCHQWEQMKEDYTRCTKNKGTYNANQEQFIDSFLRP